MERGELNDLMAFAAVARERSFTRAAAALGISPSALSHAIRGLEERLGVRLLARTTRSVAPTDAGLRLLQHIQPAFTQIEAGLEALGEWRDSPSGKVRLTTFSYPARTILRQKLPTFLLENPDVEVEVDINDRLVDIVTDGFDAGIRFGETVAKDMIAVRVGPDLRTVVVGTPSYFENRKKPEVPADLEGHNCIGYRLASAGGLLPWEFQSGAREIKIRTSGSFVVNDGDLAAAAVRAGAGLGYIMEDDVADDIAAGRLIRVLDAWCPPFQGCYLYHPSRRQTPPALRALIAALKEEA
ncbi:MULTISPECIES: LysR family transcriptional regulator [Rhizobium]|uniref:LysR family transcriptional regulator n=1 Tax=Rhizobium rhododendri TaxID=2506430 RepID=A0ABY8IDL8_9HYPH|nr:MULTISPECIES: LysR family transcriptional regulator [Rhizobium]MBZ5758598.1 LysR family transcriptional regulator [Rhizobium sp. VS19-DR96]MBZ5764572.1 LysR family transcriptional regulator [Rhizobium sp. VS19-DR129.2]MBZ5772115.1 LysR family transcriptional regulator [Rhizobium sp. VS19-DRK62.2]MBZ5783198.1 LysR family transcriptional regulator [Rhizobium sp. VS19-DR121]MBZ5800646.1 LysR family transcriptional regulator [Rhizobium sp. VS19-DR181]